MEKDKRTTNAKGRLAVFIYVGNSSFFSHDIVLIPAQGGLLSVRSRNWLCVRNEIRSFVVLSIGVSVLQGCQLTPQYIVPSSRQNLPLPASPFLALPICTPRKQLAKSARPLLTRKGTSLIAHLEVTKACAFEAARLLP